MLKNILKVILCIVVLLFVSDGIAVPVISGEPIIVQHLGKLEWPHDTTDTMPYLTQLAANDINDLHGDLSCELIISTPGNYHMALRDAMFGHSGLNHVGLLEQENTPSQFKVSICWSTSPPISVDQISAEQVQFKNIKMIGRPALVMAPGGVMNTLEANGMVDTTSRQAFLRNHGNVILIRSDKVGSINNVCDLGGGTRVVTPSPSLEPGSFSNFSGTVFNVADKNTFGCDATILFNSIFSQNLNDFDLSAFANPYDINGVLSVFGKGTTPQFPIPKWLASSRIMHRDIPYALCHDEADAAVIFYHQAKWLVDTLAGTGCNLAIVPIGGTVTDPQPLPGNQVGTLHIAKVNGTFTKKIRDARDIIYDFLTTNPIWEQILNEHGMVKP